MQSKLCNEARLAGASAGGVVGLGNLSPSRNRSSAGEMPNKRSGAQTGGRYYGCVPDTGCWGHCLPVQVGPDQAQASSSSSSSWDVDVSRIGCCQPCDASLSITDVMLQPGPARIWGVVCSSAARAAGHRDGQRPFNFFFWTLVEEAGGSLAWAAIEDLP